jgi:hypothetical protein
MEEHIGNQKEVLKEMNENCVMAQNRVKQQEYQLHSEREFEMGDWLFMRLQLYKQMSLKQQNKDNKLAPKYYGPYKVLKRIESMVFKLEFHSYSRVHTIFHVSFLKKVINNKITVQTILPEINEGGKVILEPQTIFETRIKQLINLAITE